MGQMAAAGQKLIALVISNIVATPNNTMARVPFITSVRYNTKIAIPIPDLVMRV